MAKIEKLDNNRVKIEIDVTAEQFEAGLDYAYEQIKDDVDIKGFRKGKVPRHVYEQQKGVQTLYEEALNHVLQETYGDVIEKESLEVVAQPKIDLDVTKLEKGKGFTYTATVAVKPDVELGEYKGFTYEYESTDVTDEEIDAKINELIGQNAELIVKEEGALEENDTAVFDFEGFVDNEPFEGGKAENHEMVIGSNQFIPGFENQMVGMNPGEEREIKVTFPDEYQAENLAGKDAVFKTKLHEIKVKQTPELTDDFVKELDKEGVETVDALKADTKETLVQEKTETRKNKAIDFAIEEAAKNATVDIPEEMIEQEKDRQMDNVKRQAQQYGIDFDTYLQLTGTDKDTFEKNAREQAEKSIRYNLTIEAVAEKEGIDAEQKEIDAKFEELSKQYNMDVEQIKQQVNDNAVKQEVIFRKAIDFLVENLETE